MPAYRQDHSFYEDEYGTVTITFVISDTYEALFGSSFVLTNIFKLTESSKDLEQSEGVQTEDEVRFKINEVLVETEDDQAALDFVLLGSNPANKRFCALFINTGSTPSIDDAEFTGVLRADFKANDLKWHGDAFTTEPAPLREWDISAQSFFTNVFDEVEVKDLIFGNEDLMVDPITHAGWVDSNVADREGYARTGSSRTTKYAQLVNLSKLLQQMAYRLTESIEARALGEYFINFLTTTFDFKLSPARFNTVSKYGKHPRYTSISSDPSYTVKADDAVTVGINATGFYSEEQSFHVSYALFDPSVVDSPPGSDEATYKITGNIKKFTDLLYAIAANTGCFVEFEYSTSTVLNVAFRPRKDILKGAVYIRDVVKADLNTKPRSNAKADQYYADSFGLATEGADAYHFGVMGGRQYYPSDTMKSKRTGKRLPLSVSPTLRYLDYGDDEAQAWLNAKFPHNVRFYDGDTIATRTGGDAGNESVNSQGITTAIYLKVLRNGEYGFDGGDELYAPAAMVTAKINGVDMVFNNLSEYINFITDRDILSFETEYNLTIPFLCGFRKSQDGSHTDDDGGRGSWKNLRLGSEITIDTIEYAVVGIKRSLDKPETTLRLHNVSRFAFGEAEALGSDITPPVSGAYISGGVVTGEGSDTPIVNNSYGDYEPGEAIVEGNWVSQFSDGKVYNGQGHHAHVLRGAGIATQTVDVDDTTIRVLEAGTYSSSRYEFTPGEGLFVRTGDLNVSMNALTAPTEDEDAYISIARAKTFNSLVIRRGFEFFYNPPIPDA